MHAFNDYSKIVCAYLLSIAVTSGPINVPFHQQVATSAGFEENRLQPTGSNKMTAKKNTLVTTDRKSLRLVEVSYTWILAMTSSTAFDKHLTDASRRIQHGCCWNISPRLPTHHYSTTDSFQHKIFGLLIFFDFFGVLKCENHKHFQAFLPACSVVGLNHIIILFHLVIYCCVCHFTWLLIIPYRQTQNEVQYNRLFVQNACKYYVQRPRKTLWF